MHFGVRTSAAHLRALLWIHRTPGIESALILEDGRSFSSASHPSRD